jgi:hypothetical protein
MKPPDKLPKKRREKWKLTRHRPLRIAGTIIQVTAINRGTGGVTLQIESEHTIKRIRSCDIDAGPQ